MPVWFSLPRVPNLRSGADLPAIEVWLNDLRREVSRALTEMQTSGATKALVGWRGEQTVPTGFTIDPNAPLMLLNATAPQTSNPTQAILDGTEGQFLFLKNQSTNNITLLNGANTLLGGATYAILGQNDTMALMWDGDTWTQMAPVSVNRGEDLTMLGVVPI